MQRGQATILIVVGILVLVGVAGGYILLGKSKNITPVTQPAPETINSQPTPTIESTEYGDISDWKTYTNNKHKFSFDYPDSYFNYDGSSEDSVYLAPRAGKGESYGSPMGLEKKDVWLSISVNPIESGISLEEFISHPEMYDYKDVKKEKITIANKNGYKVTSNRSSGPQATVSYEGFVENGGNIYRIQMYAFTLDVLLSQQKIFDQILSTFKFIQ